MSEERGPDDIEEDFEDLDELETVSLDIEEISDLEDLEEIPEDQEVGFTSQDIVITYDEEAEDEIEKLERKFFDKLKEMENVDPDLAIREFVDLLNESKILEANETISKISYHIASLLTNQGYFKDATEYYLQAVSEARKSSNKIQHLRLLTPFGINLMNFDFKDASVVFSQAIKLAEELEDKEAYARNTIYFADCLSLDDKKQAIKLYNESKEYFNQIGDKPSVGNINFRIGNLHLQSKDYQEAYEFFDQARAVLVEFPEIKTDLRLNRFMHIVRHLLYSGHSLKLRLPLTPPETIKETQFVKEIYELLAERGSFDIIKGLKKIKFIQEPSEEEYYDTLKCIFEESNHSEMYDDELKVEAQMYEQIGDIFIKDKSPANAFYNYVGAQILYNLTKESKRADKLTKKVNKLILELAGDEHNRVSEYELYLYYQIAMRVGIQNKKAAENYANKAIDLSKKKDNPLYEALSKEVLAEIRSDEGNIDKAVVEYESAITLFENLEDYVDLLRIYEKYGTFMLNVHVDKGQDILGKALEIAKKMENQTALTFIRQKLEKA
jgi:tetratricopeptide (TPR) repeat protein